MGKNILPIGDGIIKYSQDYAFLTSTMYLDQSFYNWILSNMIQVYYVPKKDGKSYELAFFYLGNEVNPINNISLFDHQIVKMDFLKRSSLDLLEFTKLMIDENYYVTNTLDEYYIDTSFYYNQKHFEHGRLIYGYDDNEKQVYTAGYDVTGHFNFHTIPYTIYDTAFKNTKRNSRISCFRRNDKFYEIDKKLIKSLLYEFVTSTNSSENCRMIQNPLNNCRWGVDAFECICDTPSYKDVSMLYEYIILMKKRAEYFKCSELINKFEELSKNTRKVSNMMIKENIKQVYTDKPIKEIEKVLNQMKSAIYLLYNIIQI